MAGIDGITNLDASNLNRFLSSEGSGYAIKACNIWLDGTTSAVVQNINGFEEVITEPSTDVWDIEFDENFTALPVVIPCVQNPSGLMPLGYTVEMQYVSAPANLSNVRFMVVYDNALQADAEVNVMLLAIGKVGSGVVDGTTSISSANLNKFVSSEHTTRLYQRSCIITLNGASPAVATATIVSDNSGISVASSAGIYTLTFSGDNFSNPPIVLFGVQSDGTSVKGYTVERMYDSSAQNLSEIKFKVVKDNAHVTDANCKIHVLMIGRIV